MDLPADFLNHLRIASPCDASWEAMTGDDRVRHCAHCDRNVYQVAHLTTAEVAALFQADGLAPCLRLWRRADGTVLTADCPVGLRRRGSRRLRVRATLLGLLLASLPSLLRAQAPEPRVQGKVAAPTRPAPKGRRPKVRPLPPLRPEPPLMGAVACPPPPTSPRS